MDLRTRALPRLLNREVEAYLQENDIILVPVGAVEMHGDLPLDCETVLSEAAAVRAREIARSFSHTRPSGASFSSALSESGVSYLRAGENIASGQKSASEVVNAWMNSPGHRANILNSSYSRIGSASVNIDGTHYWVQLFAD